MVQQMSSTEDNRGFNPTWGDNYHYHLLRLVCANRAKPHTLTINHTRSRRDGISLKLPLAIAATTDASSAAHRWPRALFTVHTQRQRDEKLTEFIPP